MIVTADKQGDFNATSQILRYSALAREVTVPRIPSITSNFSSSHQYESKSHKSQRQGVFAASAEELETAALEIAKISDEYDALTLKLSAQEYARAEAEFRWKAAEEHCLSIEQEVREECWAEMEARVEEEKRRWQQAWEEQVCHFFFALPAPFPNPNKSSSLLDMMNILTESSTYFPKV